MPMIFRSPEFMVKTVVLVLSGSIPILGLNIVLRRMQHFVSHVICLAKKMEHLLLVVGGIGMLEL